MSLNDTLKGQSSEEFSFSSVLITGCAVLIQTKIKLTTQFPCSLLGSVGDYTHINLYTKQLHCALCAVIIKDFPRA
jgi:hypothetical protein